MRLSHYERIFEMVTFVGSISGVVPVIGIVLMVLLQCVSSLAPEPRKAGGYASVPFSELIEVCSGNTYQCTRR